MQKYRIAGSAILFILYAGVFLVNPVWGMQSSDPETFPLWASGAPDGNGEPADEPTLTVYEPATGVATGTAVVIAPGGGYGMLAMDHEGHDVARWLNTLGITAFILKYRHAPKFRHPTPLRDGQRALRLVRARAGTWGIDTDKVGILGFSAGGHLASSAGTHADWDDPMREGSIDVLSARPDFMVLVYPVISMTESYMHRGSRDNLLGKDATEALALLMSNEKQVDATTPPAFLMHTTEDKAVPPENSIYFYLALREAGVGAEMHIYEAGRHGVGLAPGDPVLSTWPARCAAWLKANGF
ncbi:MAG: alpha/beta hydrolase [Bacteroidota bacterium]